MRVLKFGGTSLGDRDRIEEAARLIRAASDESRLVVVASAVGGVTNSLAALIETTLNRQEGWTEEVDAIESLHLEILAGPSPGRGERAAEKVREIVDSLRFDLVTLAGNPLDRAEISDRVLAVGERLSVQLVAATLQAAGCAARVVDASDLIATDSTFGEAAVDFGVTRLRCQRLLAGRDQAIPIVTGFIGADEHGRTTTLGRGGSDYSAAVIGAAIDAERVEIWTDVDGVLTAPPSLVPSVSSIPGLSYEEAAELSYFGAKVLHPATVRPLAERGIPILVRNTFEPHRHGTEVSSRSGAESRVVAVSANEDVSVLRLRAGTQGIEGEVLMSCRASSDGATLVAVSDHRAKDLIEKLRKDESLPLEHHYPASIITLVGHDIALQPWVAGRALESIARRGIAVHSFAAGAGPHTIVLLVERADLEPALCTIHGALMLDRVTETTGRKQITLGKKEVRHVPAA